jgi:prepilin-type N-terminal cleavage/methylation domain-containing protein
MKRTIFRREGIAAFTLVELLVVTTIIGILTAITVPALSSLNNQGNMNQAVNGVSLLLDEARSYAMAHDTYVWVGFYQDNTAQKLTVGVVAGTTGQSSDLSSTSTYAPINKLQTYNNLSLKAISSLAGTGLASMANSADDISNPSFEGIFSFQQTGKSTSVTFNSEVVQFSPRGEATLGTSSDGSHWIQIGLQPVRGSNTGNPNVAVFQVAKLTGLVNVFRP